MFNPFKRNQAPGAPQASDKPRENAAALSAARELELRAETLDPSESAVNARGAIEPALAFISENYTQDLRIADMAASCAMSESYFRKTFDRIMGMPPLEYVNRYRIREAVSLLLLTDDTVLTIAGMTGFSSIATFNRNFRRYVGMAPEEWRKNAHA